MKCAFCFVWCVCTQREGGSELGGGSVYAPAGGWVGGWERGGMSGRKEGVDAD